MKYLNLHKRLKINCYCMNQRSTYILKNKKVFSRRKKLKINSKIMYNLILLHNELLIALALHSRTYKDSEPIQQNFNYIPFNI